MEKKMKRMMVVTVAVGMICCSLAEIGDKVSFSPIDVNTYRVNALKGDADAMYLYSVCLYSGYMPGGKRDQIAGTKFAREAAKKGCELAFYWVAEGYAQGHGVERSKEEADKFFNYFVQWAKKPNSGAFAKCYLGHYYAFGKGGKPDPAKAVPYYLESAKNGNMDGMYAIGSCYVKGFGVKKDEKAGINWLTKSAAQGFSPAMHQLGKCYEEGIGVAANEQEAIEWYSKAAIQGDEKSFKALERLLPQKISKDEI
jgi:TPR repeat protein